MLDNIDVDLFKNKGLYLKGNFTDKYFELLKKYKFLLEKYLIDKLPIKKYDDLIGNSKYLLSPIKKDDMDFYQSFSSMRLNYIYLRNNLSVEKLSIEDISFILNLNDIQVNNPNEDVLKLIDRTYRDVIDCRVRDFDIILKKCYGIDRDDFWISSNELVFGLRYDEFINNDLDDNKKWLNNYNEQLSFVGNIIDELNVICSKILNIKVNFLYYDEFTVKNSLI